MLDSQRMNVAMRLDQKMSASICLRWPRLKSRMAKAELDAVPEGEHPRPRFAGDPVDSIILGVGWLAFGAVGLGASAVVFAGLGLFAPTLLPL